MSAWFEFAEYLRHRWRAAGPHGVHSPFIFRLVTEVLPGPYLPSHWKEMSELRADYRKDRRTIYVEDHGAGSRVHGRSPGRVVADVAGNAGSNDTQLRLLARLVHDRAPSAVLELGTCLGFGTSVLADSSSARVWSVEGSPALADEARALLDKLQLKAEIYTGTFDQVLPERLPTLPPLDVVVIDGDHRGPALLRYVDMIYPHLAPDAMIICDDIHWSADMKAAWDQLRQDSRFPLTADLFEFGLLWNQPRLTKEHFVLRVP